MSNTIQNRYEFVYLFDVENGNPNGDPDAGNMPRIDPETGHGIVTDVCLKRKIRNFVTITKQGERGFEIYVKERGILAVEQRKAYEALKDDGVKASGQANEKARGWMCKNFFDVRAFGAVMTTGKIEKEDKEKHKALIDLNAKNPQWNCGQVRGPVQFTFARSIEPVLPLEYSITRVALTNVSDTRKEAVVTEEGEKAGSGQFGRKHAIPYGLYRSHGFVSPHLAGLPNGTGFSEHDLNLLWEALCNMFEHDRSAARGLMSTRQLIIFKHDSGLGNAPAHSLFERVTVRRVDESKPAREFKDYKVEINEDNLPAGISIMKRP
jgi:CRISPR-associated protein Csd2